MSFKKYIIQFVVLFIWIICVLLLFKLIPDKQTAAFLAGLGFIFFPILFLFFEFKKKSKRKSHVLILSLFLLISALPIFLLRVLNWGVDFNTLSLFGISADLFHRMSNIFYLLMMASCLAQYFREKYSK